MNKKIVGKIKLVAIVVVVACIIWFLIISPRITFMNYEKSFEDAAKRYFELNSDLLPTGERIKKVSLSTLFNESYVKEDFKDPYTGGSCSIENSWVKVKRVNGKFTYYTYLDCGLLKSGIDHEGPTITLKGKSDITVEYESKFKDQGVSSVVDNVDGKIDVSKVTVRGDVDTSTEGTYELTYSVYDSMNNRTIVTRKVKVVRTFYSTVKKTLGDQNYFKGDPTNNYVYLSNMLFRIHGIDKNKNVILVADNNISYASFDKLDKWLDYFYDNLVDGAKKLLVKNKFCNMKVDDSNINSTKCNSFTKDRYVYVPSIIEINNGIDPNEPYNFIKPFSMSWTANYFDDNIAYTVRQYNVEDGAQKNVVKDNVVYNYGIRPMLILKGDTVVKSGYGDLYDPYRFGEVKKAKGGDLLNTRYVGEYFNYKESYWIITENKDGKIKAVANEALEYEEDFEFKPFEVECDENDVIYNPTKKTNFAYQINNKATEYFDSSLFEVHEFEVPIYEDRVKFREEVKTKKYKLKFAAPNMFEMFSFSDDEDDTFYFINSSKKKGLVSGVIRLGVPGNEPIPPGWKVGVRISGYVKDGFVISSGDGSFYDPYIIK